MARLSRRRGLVVLTLLLILRRRFMRVCRQQRKVRSQKGIGQQNNKYLLVYCIPRISNMK